MELKQQQFQSDLASSGNQGTKCVSLRSRVWTNSSPLKSCWLRNNRPRLASDKPRAQAAEQKIKMFSFDWKVAEMRAEQDLPGCRPNKALKLSWPKAFGTWSSGLNVPPTPTPQDIPAFPQTQLAKQNIPFVWVHYGERDWYYGHSVIRDPAHRTHGGRT